MNASAVTLTFNPSHKNIDIEQPFNVDLVISGLENCNLGAFDLNVGFDNTVLTFSSYSLGNQLGDIALGDADDWSWGYLGGGTVNLAQLSWLSDFAGQLNSFTLATLCFTGVTYGSSNLILSDVILSDDFGESLESSLVSGGVHVVPEPATLLLFGSGLVGLVLLRKSKKE